MADKNEIDLLREINTRLTRLAPLKFDELLPSQQRALFTIALDRASLADVCDVCENDPFFVEQYQAKEREEIDALAKNVKTTTSSEGQ